MEEIFKNAVIEAAMIVKFNYALNDSQKERIQQEIDDFRKTTIFLLEFFQDRKYRDSLFTLCSIDEIIGKDLELKHIMDKKEIKSILETLIDNKNLGRITVGSVTFYGINSPVTLGERLVLTSPPDSHKRN